MYGTDPIRAVNWAEIGTSQTARLHVLQLVTFPWSSVDRESSPFCRPCRRRGAEGVGPIDTIPTKPGTPYRKKKRKKPLLVRYTSPYSVLRTSYFVLVTKYSTYILAPQRLPANLPQTARGCPGNQPSAVRRRAKPGRSSTWGRRSGVSISIFGLGEANAPLLFS